ncbi:NAD(P)-dependent dehydrogenase, short-chain alcohol dehydrogenase family [Pedobacter westerhofensis]|uniref:NAD(P)-dependent dehydrogenase, short-chain alcohol dehydrogenase family n=1 Tax=Pedobacter westerhofensis TaxID=425512 RepID=A0A521CZA6_9SPHI|nr:SDR family oxidoreductase [Pedobacter westerhofensis]SMO64787.1 NAD(P)-dependent dehydrogenase, short-chain alcohol dehydrogenase family [Pedobacter westerhofensis]
MELKSKIALVTGGSRGLGKNMVQSLAKKGFDVIFTYHTKKDEAQAVIADIEQLGQKGAALQLDTADIKSFDQFLIQVQEVLKDKFDTDHFDFLINNAGIAVYAPFTDTTEEQFDTLLNIHYKGVYFLSQKSLALMNDGGGIVNISTGLARFSTPGYSLYASMKGAIETLTKYMAQELGKRGINVNIVAPGAIETDFGGGMVRDNPELNKHIASITALGRVGRPDDIGSVVAFLCTEDAKWINAQRIEVSGGQNL